MLTISQIKLLFKRLLLVLGLVIAFTSVVEQSTDNYLYESSGSAQVSMMQLDKDNNRDMGDAVSVFALLGNNLSRTSDVFYFYSTYYQEPTLLVHLRPPNA